MCAKEREAAETDDARFKVTVAASASLAAAQTAALHSVRLWFTPTARAITQLDGCQ